MENWSAFAPDFKELDENVEYEERESEFDLTDEDKSVASGGDDKEDTDLEVDVCAIEPVAAFCSSDEENENQGCLQFLPTAPEVRIVLWGELCTKYRFFLPHQSGEIVMMRLLGNGGFETSVLPIHNNKILDVG